MDKQTEIKKEKKEGRWTDGQTHRQTHRPRSFVRLFIHQRQRDRHHDICFNIQDDEQQRLDKLFLCKQCRSDVKNGIVVAINKQINYFVVWQKIQTSKMATGVGVGIPENLFSFTLWSIGVLDMS